MYYTPKSRLSNETRIKLLAKKQQNSKPKALNHILCYVLLTSTASSLIYITINLSALLQIANEVPLIKPFLITVFMFLLARPLLTTLIRTIFYDQPLIQNRGKRSQSPFYRPVSKLRYS